MSDDNEDVQLPIPARSTQTYPGSASTLRSGHLSTPGEAGGGRSSRKVVETLRSASSRRLHLSSFATSNGSSKGLIASNTEGSMVGGIGGLRGGLGKACTACGIQFTWRMRRHHCRACKQAVCDPCSKERLQIVGGDSKRHRVCHPCLKQHLAAGRTREDRLYPQVVPSNRSSPFDSRNTSRNVSRDTSRHGPSGGLSLKALATYAEDQELQEIPPEPPQATAAAAAAAGDDHQESGMGGSTVDNRGGGDGGAAGAALATKDAAATAAAMAAAWSGGRSDGKPASGAAGMITGTGTGAGGGVGAEQTPDGVAVASAASGKQELRADAQPFVSAARGTTSPRSPSSSLKGGTATAETTTATEVAPEVVVSMPSEQGVARDSAGQEPVGEGEVAVATAVGVAVEMSATEAASRQDYRPPLGSGVHADPASHQHKRPVQSAKDQNPLALPWFTGNHTSPCTICEDLWKVAWGAREDFLRDLRRAEEEKTYQLVATSGDNLRLYAAANMFWGGQAIRLRVEMEVAVPLGFAMRWLASLTARGGVYYPYSGTSPCDTVEADNGSLSVACAHWPTNLSGNRRCALLRYVSEDGSPPPGVENDPSIAGKPRDPRPTIVFTTVEHPIMREWARPGVDVEVFPSGLVLEEMESSAGAVTKVHGLIGWDNKGTLQHMTKMSYMTERADRLEGLAEHLRAMECGYLEYHAHNGGSMAGPFAGPTRSTPVKNGPRPQRTSGYRSMGTPNAKPGANSGGTPAAATPAARAGKSKSGDAGKGADPSPGSPPIGFSPLPPKYVATAAEDDDGVDFSRGRMTSRAGPLSPSRGRGLSGGDEVSGIQEGHNREAQVIRRSSESSEGFGAPTEESGGAGGGGGSIGGQAAALAVGVGGISDWIPPPGHKTIPTPARAAELEAEVAFLNRQLSVRQSLEERLNMSESDKARLITKLATAQAEAAKRSESLEARLKDMTDRLHMAEDLVRSTRRQLGDAEERAMTAQRNLRLTHEALRVKSEASSDAHAGKGSTRLSMSPSDAARLLASGNEIPLSASPALRAPPPISWGSGPIAPGGGSGGDGGGEGGKGGGGGQEAGGGGQSSGKSVLLVGRTQEMGVKFAVDTLRYSEDEEVVVFMLHLVQGLRHEAHGPGTPKASIASGGGAATSASMTANSSTLARVLFKQPSSVLPPTGATPQDRKRSGSGSGDAGRAEGELSPLALLLITRACQNEQVANFLFWYLKIEAEGDAELRPMYLRVRKAMMENLAKRNAPFEAALKAAEGYMTAISSVHGMVKKKGGRALSKTARLKAALADRRLHVVPAVGGSGSGKHGAKGKSKGGGAKSKTMAIPLPLDPHTTVVGLRPATAYTFPSAMSPCVVEFVMSESVGPSFRRDDLLEDPSEDTPTKVTDISPADLKSWSGAGPLPRSGSVLGVNGKMTMHVESVHVEAWEEEGQEEEEEGGEGEASTRGSSRASSRTLSHDAVEEGGDGDDHDEDEDDAFFDRRRISADAEEHAFADDDVADSRSPSKRHRDLSGSTVGDEDESAGASARVKATRTRDRKKSDSSVGSVGGASTTSAPTEGGDLDRAGADRRVSSLTRQASNDLTKLRLWEQMQVLGTASRERGSYLAIFKNGEDMRQDQLAVHMVSLMDRQLKEAGLDLKLKSYRVLATSLTTGMIEFVPGSVPMSAVLATHNNSVLEFLRHHNADPGGPLGMKREALDNFTRSCAGSCVVTYLLGVGDRHLDNLMLLPEGVLFHIDFGYLFGKDPKLMPPPFRLTKEMVEAMGGADAPHYTVFKSLCCQAYRHLRKCAHQYLNLLSLMSRAGIKDLSDDPAAVLQLVQDRFKLDLTDEQADAHFLGLVSQSLTALAPRVMEVMHQIRVAAR